MVVPPVFPLSLHSFSRAILLTREEVDFTAHAKNYTSAGGVWNSSVSESVVNHTLVTVSNGSHTLTYNKTVYASVRTYSFSYSAYLFSQVDIFMPIYMTADIVNEYNGHLGKATSCVCLAVLHIQRLASIIADLLADLRNRALAINPNSLLNSPGANAQKESCSSSAAGMWLYIFIGAIVGSAFCAVIALRRWARLRSIKT